MVTEPQSSVFWLSYAPADDEKVSDVLKLLDRVVSVEGSALVGKYVRDGQRVFNAVICTRKRQRVSCVLGEKKWKSKGARGTICNGKYPAAGEKAQSFLRRWADAVCRDCPPVPFGSRREVYRVLRGQQNRERDRKKRSRRVSRRAYRDCCNRCSSPDDGTGLETQPALAVSDRDPEVSVQVDAAADSLSWLPHGFDDVDFSLTEPSLSSLYFVGVTESRVDANQFGAAADFTDLAGDAPAVNLDSLLCAEELTYDLNCDSDLYGANDTWDWSWNPAGLDWEKLMSEVVLDV
ncbi:hypothetical protein HIM_11774 [Hirsutella minnesotensis 3608]|uniref:Uncharacterized protein n=1 Tax=Hirsutella minnesotensis 3608 TaxID=1043627 RepID=A0A0F8A0T4_9HYPO|nr:hypothetical protein HIM_11774 [Hirsutella minnesotensis 3608]